LENNSNLFSYSNLNLIEYFNGWSCIIDIEWKRKTVFMILKNSVITMQLYLNIYGNQMHIVCVISFFVHYHSSLLFPVKRILHVSLYICNTYITILYIVKIRFNECTYFSLINWNDRMRKQKVQINAINSSSLIVSLDNVSI
jgi:hypothetical protein